MITKELKKKNLSELTIPEMREIVKSKGRDEEKRLYIHSRIADKFSIYQTKLFLKLGLSANTVSFIGIVIYILSTILLWVGDYWLNIIFYIIFLIASFIDYSDGEIARYWMWRKDKKRGTLKGLYTELASHPITDTFIFFGIGIGAWNRFDNIYYFYVGIALSFMMLLNQMLKLKEYETIVSADRINLLKKSRRSKPEISSRMRWIYNLFKPQTILYSLFFWALIFNVLHWFLILTLIVFTPRFIKSIFDVLKRLERLDKDEEK